MYRNSGSRQNSDNFFAAHSTLTGLLGELDDRLRLGNDTHATKKLHLFPLEALSQFTKIPELKEVRFKNMKLPFRVERGRMITDPVVLTGSNGDWRLSGGIGFDGSLDYAVSTTLPPDVVKKLGADAALVAGALSGDDGRILIDLRVSGNAKSPRIDWDKKAMGERAKGQLSSTLEKQRAKLEAELLKAGIDRATAIAILTWARAQGRFYDLIGRMDSDRSPAECRVFDLDECDI